MVDRADARPVAPEGTAGEDGVRRRSFRHVPPVYSPLPASAVLRAALRWSDPRSRLEAMLAESFEADRVVLCDSGTTALRLAIEVAASGSEQRSIALPAFGCFDLVTAAVGADVDVRFYDVDPSTLGPDFHSLERLLQAGVRAVVAAHLYGVPVDWDRLTGLAERFGAILVEDAAMGHGASWAGRPLGSLAPLGVLSFGRGKGWTGGGGGALLARGDVVTRIDALPPLEDDADAARLALTLATAAGQAAFSSPSVYGLPASVPGLGLGETVYHPPVTPRGMSVVSARLAIATRDASDAEADARRRTDRRYRMAVASDSGVRHAIVSDRAVCGALRHPMLVDGGVAALGPESTVRRLGIETSYPRMLPELEIAEAWAAQDAAVDFDPWPGARRLVDGLVTLPTHSRVNEKDLARIVRCVQRVGDAPQHI